MSAAVRIAQKIIELDCWTCLPLVIRLSPAGQRVLAAAESLPDCGRHEYVTAVES